MMTVLPPATSPLGAPGAYLLPTVVPATVDLEPLDVAAFVGVAPRGPAWERLTDPSPADLGLVRARSVAVPVDSWDDYVDHFGAFEGPGLLAHAVWTYFAEGGRRAHVVRIVAQDRAVAAGVLEPPGRAVHELSLVDATGRALAVAARNEGTWGGNLEIRLGWSTRPVEQWGVAPAELVLAPSARLVTASLLRVHGSTGESALRWVREARLRGRAGGTGRELVATLDLDVPFTVEWVEEVLADLTVTDTDPTRSRVERYEVLGLDPAHPRWLASEVNATSRLIEVLPSAALVPDGALSEARSVCTLEGEDRWSLVTPADVFGGVLEGDERGIEGLDALLEAPEVANVVVPDLYSPVPTPSNEAVVEPGTFAGPSFAPCVTSPARVSPPPAATDLVGLRLDPTDPAGFDAIVGLQEQLVLTAERLGLVALLDVPPGLRPRQILRWRARFDSSWAAAYHPWLRIPTTGPGGSLVDVPPSAAAAGIVARCERRSGVPKGPANELVTRAVDTRVHLDDASVTELHRSGIDAFGRGPDGVVLVGARTLSMDRQYRQLTVRRLLQLVERAVGRQLQWTVFEPNDELLRAGLTRAVEHLLRKLFDLGAFAGATPAESWFLQVTSDADQGRVVVEIGVAPSEPTEYILVRVVLDDNGGGITAAEARLVGTVGHG